MPATMSGTTSRRLSVKHVESGGLTCENCILPPWKRSSDQAMRYCCSARFSASGACQWFSVLGKLCSPQATALRESAAIQELVSSAAGYWLGGRVSWSPSVCVAVYISQELPLRESDVGDCIRSACMCDWDVRSSGPTSCHLRRFPASAPAGVRATPTKYWLEHPLEPLILAQESIAAKNSRYLCVASGSSITNGSRNCHASE